MRFLSVSALFPPDVIGGAEMSAFNLATWLRRQGHDVAVLSTAKSPDEEMHGVDVNGLKMYRHYMPRPYPIFNFPKAKAWQKPLWHLQDHLDPRNRTPVARVLDEFRPDSINMHYPQGIGYNVLQEIAARDIPMVYFLHDLGLACIRMSMFKDGKECAKQCTMCAASSAYKEAQIRKFRRIGFCSPSQANLDRLAEFFPAKEYPNTSILNPNKYPTVTAKRVRSKALRIIYVGRVHSTKGIDLLLEAADRMHAKFGDTKPFTVTIVGGGPDEAALKARFGDKPWCSFKGFVSQPEVSNLMVNSDVLCVPSIWLENSPGVAIQALGLGLPVLGSNKGGIPELVKDGKNGKLVTAGDIDAWQQALEELLLDPAKLDGWRAHAEAHAHEFDQDFLGNKMLGFIEEVRASNGGPRG